MAKVQEIRIWPFQYDFVHYVYGAPIVVKFPVGWCYRYV
jgi:hypothetical protein